MDLRPVAGIGLAVLAVLVASIPLGGLVTNPLHAAGILWPGYYTLAVVAAALLWRSGAWRVPQVVLLLVFWATFAAWAGFALQQTPDPRAGGLEVRALAGCAILACVIVLATRGTRSGLSALRLGWIVGMTITCGIGVWELATGDHLWVTPARPWRFGEGTVAATFINPNNFGAALVGMLVAVLAARASSPSRALRALLAGLAVFALAMIAFTQSRAGVLAALVVLLVEVHRALVAAAGDRPLRPWLREVVARHRRTAAAVLVAATGVVVASLTVPALAARNPVRAMVLSAFAPETAKSDSLRIDLIAAALRYLRDSGWVGTGAGSYEAIMWNDPGSGISYRTNLHNAFVELLSQYGVVVFAPYVALLLALTWVALRPRPGRTVADQSRVVRAEVLGHLVALAALGITASSALALQTWWLMLASAVAGAWWLRRDDEGESSGVQEAA